MSISGMTGFARADGGFQAESWAWEAKSVNGRGLDLKLRLPPGLDTLEPALREAVAKRFARGSITINLNLARVEQASASVRVDHELVRRLIKEAEPYVDAGQVSRPVWEGLLQVRGVLVADEAPEMDEAQRSAREQALLESAQNIFDALLHARQNEGRMIASVLGALVDKLDALTDEARQTAAAAPAAALQRLRQRLAALAPDIQSDPQRLAQEAAMMAARADVQEELDRLAAHASDLRGLIAQAGPAGRRLDFLTQELTREANTLCSKSSELELTRIGLELKAVIDQIKEQAANVE